jgi:uncharacterized phage protein gp47/JayE
MTTSLDTRSHATIVGTIAAGMQSRLSQFLNFAVGSVLLAFAEAYAGVCLWLQECFIRILKLTRAATSDGEDLDTWMADYGFYRLQPVAATGQVLFGLYAAKTSATTVPVGAVVKTADGSLSFTVYADPTNGAYSADLNGYVIAAGTTSVSVPVICSSTGTVGNAAAGAISLIASQVPADTVTNQAAFSNGLDAEEDPDFRSGFVAYINSLSQGTEAAYRRVIRQVQQNLRVNYVSTPGLVTIYVDDGSGAPSAALIAACRSAADTVRAGGVQVALFGATGLAASVSMTVTVADGYDTEDTCAQVIAALSVYINALPEGATLRWGRLGQIAFDASPGVEDVGSILLNGGTSNLKAAPGQTIKVGGGGLSVNPAS